MPYGCCQNWDIGRGWRNPSPPLKYSCDIHPAVVLAEQLCLSVCMWLSLPPHELDRSADGNSIQEEHNLDSGIHSEERRSEGLASRISLSVVHDRSWTAPTRCNSRLYELKQLPDRNEQTFVYLIISKQTHLRCWFHLVALANWVQWQEPLTCPSKSQ